MHKYLIFAFVMAGVLAGDQVTKVWARKALLPIPQKTVIEGYFDLRYSENPGVAFGMFRHMPGGRYILVGVGVVALAFIAAYLRKPDAEKTSVAVALGLTAGGAVGNIFDRIAFGKVTDFIVWHYHGHEWPAFNVADAALVAGVLALLLFAPRNKSTGADAGKADKRAPAG